MKKIGLTGGIGSGKTYIANIFQSIGVPVFYADLEAKKLINNSISIMNLIKKEFGDDIYIDNKLDKHKLSEIVFSDIEKIRKLNSIVHPSVKNVFDEWCQDKTTDYIIKEAAILFESKSNLDLDAIICVSAPLELRVERVKKRDKISVEEIKNRINNQMSNKKKESLSDYLIVNDEKQILISQIIKIHNKILTC